MTYEKVYEQLVHKIENNIWILGDQIPTVPQLAREFNVSVASVREAIRILSNQKVLNVEQGRGTFVVGMIGEDSKHPHFLENATLRQLTEARLIVEPELAALTALNATAQEIKQIKNVAKIMNEKIEADVKDFFDEDMQFHYLIARASKNQILFQMIDAISDLLARSTKETMGYLNRNAAHYHIIIADAIEQKNPSQAKILMKAHIQELLSLLEK